MIVGSCAGESYTLPTGAGGNIRVIDTEVDLVTGSVDKTVGFCSGLVDVINVAVGWIRRLCRISIISTPREGYRTVQKVNWLKKLDAS